MTVQTDYGWLRTPMAKQGHVVGDRVVPPQIEVDLPGVDGQPSLFMLIEVIDGVPRCTELTIKRTTDGREVRQKDLRAVELDSWIETFVALCSTEIVETKDGTVTSVMRVDQASVDKGIRTIRDARKGSRRPMNDARRKRVADIYNAHESGGIEAVQAAFSVSRSTAVRYINAARDAELIEKRING